eukprot:1486120-Rhodomonas_salina.1
MMGKYRYVSEYCRAGHFGTTYVHRNGLQATPKWPASYDMQAISVPVLTCGPFLYQECRKLNVELQNLSVSPPLAPHVPGSRWRVADDVGVSRCCVGTSNHVVMPRDDVVTSPKKMRRSCRRIRVACREITMAFYEGEAVMSQDEAGMLQHKMVMSQDKAAMSQDKVVVSRSERGVSRGAGEGGCASSVACGH